jgi:predicted nucleotidyltransferase
VHISHPEFDLFGENEGRILHVLSTLIEGSSGRRIHAISGVKTLVTTQQILNRLVDSGLVIGRPIGASILYSVNRHHILWEPITQILDAPARLEIAVIELIAELKPKGLKGAALYGSFARGKAGRDSDIDILVVHEEGILSELIRPMGDVSSRIEQLSGNVVQMLPVTIAELKRMVDKDDPLVDSLYRDARDITEGFDLISLIDLLRMAPRK